MKGTLLKMVVALLSLGIVAAASAARGAASEVAGIQQELSLANQLPLAQLRVNQLHRLAEETQSLMTKYPQRPDVKNLAHTTMQLYLQALEREDIALARKTPQAWNSHNLAADRAAGESG